MVVRCTHKPWGCEILLASTESYAGKILFIRAGQRLSLQHHARKDETLYLLGGDAVLELEADDCSLLPYPMVSTHSYRVRAGQRHRLTAVTHTRVLEISTPELSDVVRWEDDYGRTTETEASAR